MTDTSFDHVTHITAKKRSTLFPRLLVMATMLFLLFTSSASAAPADPFSGAAAAQAPAVDDGVDFNSGDWGISQENGAATYTYGIVVPPGRNGIQPALALRYSSQAPLRGGIAAGWGLDLPMIEPDLSLGIDGGLQYRATLGGASGRLVEVDDKMAYADAVAAYRVNFDSGYMRFFRRELTTIDRATQVSWTALSAEGMRYHFTSELRTENDPRWYLDHEEDRFGNRITYFRTPVFAPDGTFLEDRLDSIEYTSNTDANLVAHAKVEFAYKPLELCPNSALPVGAAMRRGYTSVDGAHHLTAINTFARDTQASDWRLARTVAVTLKLTNSRLYVVDPVNGGNPTGLSCNQNFLRRLDQIDVTAYAPNGTATVQPPLKFNYNNRIITTPDQVVPGSPNPLAETTISWDKLGQTGVSGRVVGGQKSDLLDIDADGINDWATVTRTLADTCRLIWYKGLPGGGYDSAFRTQDLPTAPWFADWKGASNPLIEVREGCTISGQIAYRDYESNEPSTTGSVFAKGQVSYHFMDYDADGKLDLVTNVWATVCHWTYDPFAPRNFVGDVCSFDQGRAANAPLDGGEPPISGPDFIAMTPEEASPLDGVPGLTNHDYIWRIYKGTGDPDQPFATSQFERTSANPPLPLPPSVADERLDSSTVTTSYAVSPMTDLDGDGFLDFIDTGDTFITDCQNEILLRECDWTVYFGNGGRNYPKTVDAFVWDAPVEILANLETETDTCGLEFIRRRATVVGLVDMTGDGLADLVLRDSANQLKYHLNTGSGFGVERSLGVSAPLDKVQTDCNTASIGGDLVDGARGFLRRLVDLDGDGLTDMIVFGNGSNSADISTPPTVTAHFNVGGVFGPAVDLPDVWQHARRLFSASYDSQADNLLHGEWQVASDFADVSGDGRPDLVYWDDTALHYISSPGLPDAPDALRSVDNGRGMTVSYDYTASSNPATVACLDSDCSDYSMPSVRWLATAIEVDPGFGQPTMRTDYSYGNPHTLSNAPISGFAESASFAGFGAVTRSFRGSSTTTHRQIRTDYDYAALNAANVTVAAAHGEQVSEAVYEVDGTQTMLRKYSTRSSVSYRVFDDVQVMLPTLSLTCKAVGDMDSTSACMARASHVLRSEQSWQPRAYRLLDEDPITCGTLCSGASADFYNLRTMTTGEGSTPAVGDVRVSFFHSPRYGQTIIDDSCAPPIIPCVDTVLALDDYQVQINRTQREERGAGDSYTLLGRTTTSYADATGLPTNAKLYHDATTFSQTSFGYDSSLGILTSVRKPAQQLAAGGSGAATVSSYDDHKLFVHETTNELGHTERFYFDVATGAPLKQEGPNQIDPSFEQIVLEASADTYVAEGQAMTNFGSADRLIGGQEFVGGVGHRRFDSLLAFDLTPIAGKTLVSAELRLHKIDSPGSQYPVTLSLQRYADGDVWSESGATFNNYPSGSNRCDQTVGTSNGLWVWNCNMIRDWVQAWSDGSVNNGLQLTRHSSLGNRDAAPAFASREHPNVTLHPQLVVTIRTGPASTAYETKTWQIDGFGRVLTHSVTFDDPVDGYVLVPTERHEYDDMAFFNSGQATSLTDYARRDRNGAVWLESRTTLDGAGRALMRSDLLDGGATADTSYFYNALGTLDRVVSPAPHLAAGTVEHSYQYDGLGRLLSTTRPDGSGIDYAYDGVTSSMAERTSDGSGRASVQTVDARGRLIRVEEQISAESASAVTQYAYDANNNLREIIDADGNVTTMEHDIAGARRAITRSGRSWSYGYDLNGNLLTEQSPIPQGADPALYTTTFDYDDLDRTLTVSYADPVITSLPAGIPTATQARALLASPADSYVPQLVALLLLAPTLVALRRQRRKTAMLLLLLAVSLTVGLRQVGSVTAASEGVRSAENSSAITIEYAYDNTQHGIGRLSQITTPLGNATSQLLSTYQYDARGLAIKETRALSLTGVAMLNTVESVEREYNVLGGLTRSTWHDGQQWTIAYDERGLIDTVNWLDPATNTLREVADYTRNAAGMPTARTTDFDQQQTYSYDTLGRPATMVVNAGAGLAEFAQRSYSYSDSGDLLSVSGHSDGLDAGASYSYDGLHRLTQADGPAGYSGAFSYSAAGNVLSAAVDWTNSAESRDVTYSYGAADPQAVAQLINVTGGNSYGSFAYDASGNMTSRTVNGGTTLLTWDAANQIRLAVTQSGSEMYLYDHAGARVAAVNSADGIRVWFAERESRYTLDGTLLETYLHPSGGGATLARVTDASSIELQYADAQQNLMFTLDEAGQMVARFLYGPFGEVVHSDGAADHRRQFNGKENDAETGLRYYGYRYYDPVLLRWNSADPLYRFAPDIGSADPQRLNLYSFSLNNPVRYYDPDGRDAEDGAEGSDQICRAVEEANDCALDPADEQTPESADADSSGNDSATRDVVDGAIEATKVKAGVNTGVENNKRKKAEKPKPSIGIGKSVSAISQEAEIELALGKLKATIDAFKAEIGVTCSADGCTASVSVELASVEACASACMPIIFSDYEACPEVCVGAGVGASAEAGTGGVKAGAKAGIGGSVGISIRKRSQEEWTLFYDEFAPTPRYAPYRIDAMEDPLHKP